MTTEAIHPGDTPVSQKVPTTRFSTDWGRSAVRTMREELGDSIVSDVENLDYDPEALNGRVAYITGATSGIGRATALLFARDGAKVAIVGRKEDEAQKTRSQILEAGGNDSDILITLGDLTDSEVAQRTVTETVAKFGRIDIGVLNAGIIDDVGIMEMTPKQWYNVAHGNLDMTFFPAQAIARQMTTQTGEGIPAKSLVFMGSISETGNPGQPNYSAAKGGIHALTKAFAREDKLKDVVVGLFRPGFVDTEIISNHPYEKILRFFARQMPIKRMITPEEAAKGVAYLATRPDSGHILTLT